MTALDDHSLLELIRTADREAFTELYNRFWKELYTYALKRTGDEDDAQDVVQELFVELWEKRQRLPIITVGVKGYLHGSLFFKLADHFRRKGFHDRHQKNFEAFLKLDEEGAFANDPITVLEREIYHESLVALVNEAIAAMPEKMREVFVMSRSGEYSIAEIAEILNVSQQNVKNQIGNAFKRIRKDARTRNLSGVELAAIILLTHI